jgi:hypothetical protein
MCPGTSAVTGKSSLGSEMKYGQVKTGKLYFSSNEAAEQIGVSVDVLLSWEKEFPNLKPQKNKNGKRIYRQNDIEIARQIKEGSLTVQKQPRKTKAKKNTGNNELLLKIRNNLQKALNKIK